MNMNKQQLQEKIIDLEEINRLQKDKINELELRLLGQPIPAYIVDHGCINGGYHEYPTAWHATVPPFCKKCGKQAEDMSPTWIARTTTGDAPVGYNPSLTSDQVVINDDFVLTNDSERDVSSLLKI
jgi:hypothetical protein